MVDLGEVQGPLLIFGGPYSNLQATQAIKAEAERRAIPPEQVLCTGDLVAYCADPVATVELIRQWGIAVVMGNCEQSLASDAEGCGCGFEPGTACDLLSRQWFEYASHFLDRECREWMGGLPRQVRMELAGREIVAIHGGVDEISRFIFASSSETVKLAEIAKVAADIVIAGHSGIPFTQTLPGGRTWHNAGAIGMPANDGSSDVWYSLLQQNRSGLRFTHHRLSYDHRSAAQQMRRVGLAEVYAAALESGLWPSLDILPDAEQALTGQRLTLAVTED